MHHGGDGGVEDEGDEEEEAEDTDDAEGAQEQAGRVVYCSGVAHL